MRRILFILACFAVFGFANNVVDSEGKNATQNLSPDEARIVHTAEDTSTCTPSCFKLNDNIRTYIEDFDAKTGITYCKSNRFGISEEYGFSVNTYNPACKEQTSVTVSKEDLETYKADASSFLQSVKIGYNEPEGFLPFSRFISAMMTLDPEIIDFKQTNSSGTLKLKSGYTLKGIDVSYSGRGDNNDNLDGIVKSVADKFNQANLAYYSNLFANMSEIYGYVQNLLFVFVGMFFIGQIGYSKANMALEKQGGSLGGGGGDSQWLSRFMTPVLAVGFFFAPIPDGNGMNSTIVQKGIRYMTQQSGIIADRASAIGVNTYMQKLYATVGASNMDTEANARVAIAQAEKLMPIYDKVLQEKCYERYPNTVSFLNLTKNQSSQISKVDQNKYRDSNADDITVEACQMMEYRLRVQYEIWLENSKLVAGIEKVYKGVGGSDIKQFLTKVNTSLQERQNQLGWANAIIIPATSILIESLGVVQDHVAVQTAAKPDGSLAASLVDVSKGKLTEKASSNSRNSPGAEQNPAEMQAKIGRMVGNFAFFMLPGAKGMYGALIGDGKETKYQEEATYIANHLNVRSKVTNSDGEPLTFNPTKQEDMLGVTATLYQWMLEKAPIVFSVIAGVIAFIGYVVELAKFFYISPFVVAFALTTKKTHKIVDFMVTGLTVFFKPILLVIFIFFAIFIHILIQDIFLYYTMEQFDILKSFAEADSESILSTSVIDLVQVMLQIFGSIGAAYIMWKLIISGPTWAMKMVGVDNAQNDMVSEALSQRMDRSFRM